MDAEEFGFWVEDGFEAKERPRDRFFDPYRVPRSASAHAFVRDLTARVDAHETAVGARKRRRRLDDQVTFEATVAALASNLAITVALGMEDEGFVVSRSKRHLQRPARYRAPAENKTFPDILDVLDEPALGLLGQTLGSRDGSVGQRTKVKPTGRLVDLVSHHDLEAKDFGTAGAETIELRAGKREADRMKGRKGQLILYDDTAETRSMRAEMARINAALFSADLDFDEAVLEDSKVVDIGQRQLRRMFTEGRLTCGGRLFGGFWQGLRKAERLEGLTIDGEPVIELDYGQMSLRILYGQLGEPMPGADLYLVPGLERWRSGLKTFLNARLFDTDERTRKPRNTASGLPRDLSAGELTARLKAHLPGIASQFGSGVGHTLQRTESDILVEVLLRLLDNGVTALPIHDAVLVASTHADLAEQTMLQVFRRKVGQNGVVTKEEGTRGAATSRNPTSHSL